MSDNKHVYELIGKDQFNIKILNETLWDIKESIFNNLYDAQKSLSGMIRFDFDMANMTKFTETECSYNLNLQFITNKNRTKFKQSKFYKKLLTPDEINSNPNIFSNNIFVFINGEMYTNYRINMLENITTVSFRVFEQCPVHKPGERYIHDGFTKLEIRDLIESHSKMTVLIVKAHNISTLHSNRGTIRNYTIVPKYNGIPIVNFENSNMISETNNFTTWITYDDTQLYKYKFIKAFKNEENKLKLNSEQVLALTNIHTDIRNIFLLNHFDTIDIPAGTKYFELPIKDMPVPIENIIIFRKSGIDVFFDHTTKVILHYPNIYELYTGHDDDMIIYIYYADDTKSIGSKYENELSLYYRFTKNVLEKYADNSIPDIIKNYKPISMTYDHDDWTNSKLDHLKYKMNKLNNMIYKNGNYYSIYLHKLIGYIPTFDIDVSEIDDLTDRYRSNNFKEIKETTERVTFNETCYLFTFRYKKGDKINILIDSYQTNDLYTFHDNRYYYIYIPIRMINSNSRITVEKFVDYRYKQSIEIIDNISYHKVNIPEDQYIQPSDIYVTTKSLDDQNIYLSKNDYSLYAYLDGGYYQITSNDFYNYKKIYIKFINPLDIGKTVDINVNRVSFKQVVKGSNEVIIDREINNDRKNILLYRNGRLIPQKLRRYLFSDNASGPHAIRGMMKQDPNDEYTLVYNSNKYFMVHYERRINKKGIVNLTGKINKPLDFKWYDIYLNGLRLHESNIEIVAPYIFILKDVPTLTNLEIYQKNLDCLDWGDDYPTDDISSKIFDEIIDDIEDGLPDIEDTIPDLIDDIIVEIEEFFNEYLWNYIKLINPDTLQITQSMVDKYPTLFINTDNDLFLNPDILHITENNILLNPDTNTILKT